MSQLDNTTGITVSITLFNAGEVARFERFVADILYGRTGVVPEGLGKVAQSKVKEAVTLGGPLPGETPEQSAPTITITPVSHGPSPVIADISPDSVERKFREFIHSKGTADARKLLDAFGLQHLKDLPAEKRAAFVAELRV